MNSSTQKSNHHFKILLTALRSSLLILGGLIFYDLLKNMILIWDQIYYHKQKHHVYYRLFYQLIGVFILDLVILYFAFYYLGIQLH